RRAGGASDGDSQEEAGSGPSRHADQHGQSSLDLPGSRAVGCSRRAVCASDRDEQEEAGSGPSRHADQHEQSHLHTEITWSR
ncbi:TPR domain protein, partial [Pyrenophora tritici-repentis]